MRPFRLATVSLLAVSLTMGAISSQAQDTAPTSEATAEAIASFTLLNLNTATKEDFLTIPDMSDRMTREFEEYRPYISISQFRKEIGKYVDEAQVTAYEQYVYVPIEFNDSDAATLEQIPGVTPEIADALITGRPYDSAEAFVAALGDVLTAEEADYGANFVDGYIKPFTLLNLNTATKEDFLTIPDMSDRMTREFEEYRPYVSISQFRKEIGKYVDEAQVTAYEQYVYVPIEFNDSDAATLEQIPGVTPEIADALITGRPYDSAEAFVAALGEHLTPAQAAYGANFVDGYTAPVMVATEEAQ